MFLPAYDEKLECVNFGLEILQKKRGLTYGTDALLLAAYVRGRTSGRAADLGAGSGVIGLLCAAKEKFRQIYSVEIQLEYAELCTKNAAMNRLDQRMSVICRDLRSLTASDTEGELDAIMTNPPYMTVGSGKRNEDDGKYIARHEVYGGIGDFCAAGARLLKCDGSFYVVYRPDRIIDLIAALRENRLEPKRMTMVYRDTNHIPSLALIEAKKDGAPSCFVTKPLILYENGLESDDLKYIMETGNFDESYYRA